MGAAFAWGFLAASSLVVGGIIAPRFDDRAPRARPRDGLRQRRPDQRRGLRARGRGLRDRGRGELVAFGLFAGCGTFFLGDTLIDRYGGEGRKKAAGSCRRGRRVGARDRARHRPRRRSRVGRDRPGVARRRGRFRGDARGRLPLQPSGGDRRDVRPHAVRLVGAERARRSGSRSPSSPGSPRSQATPCSTEPRPTPSRSCSPSRAARS